MTKIRNTEVLLIEPPATNSMGNLRTLGSIGTFKAEMAWPPLDLMIISGLLEKHGISSEILDANSLRASAPDVKKMIEQKKPRLVVFTTSTPTFYHDLKIAEITKEVSNDIFTAVTSTHINARPAEALDLCKDVDFAVPNDSESSFLNLIKSDYNPIGISGISYRQDNQITSNPPRNDGENLDELGFPSHDKIPLDVYRDPFLKQRPMTVTLSSRGCVNQPPCIMCSACFYGQPRYRNVDALIEELHWIQSLGIKEIRFPFEAGFNDFETAMKLFNKMIKEGINLKFTCNGRADRLPVELLEVMKEAGCTAINIGCESASPQILEFCNKKVGTDQVREAVENVKKFGMLTLVYFILGLPYEDKQTMLETLEFAKKLKSDFVTFGVAIPHPSTAFFGFLKEKGYLTTENWDEYDPLGPPPYNYPNLSSQEIYSFARKAYRSYYLRPEYMLKKLFNGNLKEDFRNFLGFCSRYVLPKRD
ncbi:MAG: radical SAM protein [Sedimentisphaerales bacterium]|nr:radical SAM protein [Sedimentisphaerales bacterium]